MESYHILVNKTQRLTREDCPRDLVIPNIPFAPQIKPQQIRQEAAANIEHMFYMASQQGIYLAGVSGYRSYERQEEIYQESLRKKGAAHTKQYIAPPGGSEHQTGLAMDVSCRAECYELEETFSKSKEGIWLEKNASLFGFIIRYPKGKEEITGYAYEPWHIRYVTKELACYLKKTALTLEEWHVLSEKTCLSGGAQSQSGQLF